MPDWRCTRCGVVNLIGTVRCEGCDAETAGVPVPSPVREGYQRLEMPAMRPCSDAQNKAAWRITMDVMEGKCKAQEGKRRLAELFGMPELVNEW